MPFFLAAVSRLLGWAYTLCWSLSFYPQPILNLRRRSTRGTTIDFPAINVLGFAAYLASTASFVYAPRIRHEYALRHHGLTPTVHVNDVAFAGHALFMSVFALSQYIPGVWNFERRSAGGPGARVSKSVIAIIAGSALAIAVSAVAVVASHGADPQSGWAWIDVIYTLSYVKLFVTLVKYMPQVLTNHRNRSTNGWSIEQIFLDFAGGVFSIAQLGLDSYLQRDWSGITGNPVKLALGDASIFFDVVFMVQHYLLYRGTSEKILIDDEEEPLLGSNC